MKNIIISMFLFALFCSDLSAQNMSIRPFDRSQSKSLNVNDKTVSILGKSLTNSDVVKANSTSFVVWEGSRSATIQCKSNCEYSVSLLRGKLPKKSGSLFYSSTWSILTEKEWNKSIGSQQLKDKRGGPDREVNIVDSSRILKDDFYLLLIGNLTELRDNRIIGNDSHEIIELGDAEMYKTTPLTAGWYTWSYNAKELEEKSVWHFQILSEDEKNEIRKDYQEFVDGLSELTESDQKEMRERYIEYYRLMGMED